MAGWKLDTDGTVLDLTDGATYSLLAQSAPMPDVDAQYASSVDSTRDALTALRYRNRTITLNLHIYGASAAALEAAIGDLQHKTGKLNRDAIVGGTGVGGTLQYTSPTATAVVFDVVRASVNIDMGWTHTHSNVTTAEFVFECLPAWRGAETTPGDHTETTLPVLTFTESSVTGDLPGLGRLVIDEDQSKDQLTVVYGVRSKNYSSDSTAALFWQAEALTAVGAGATAAAGPSGASGSGSNTMYANALTTTYQDLLKSTVSTTYWTHVGAYRVLVRAQAKTGNTGDVSLRASWAQADVTNYTQGTAAQLSAAGSWCMVDLGVVQVPAVVTGTQRWELRVQGSSTVNGDAAYVDFIWLVPVDECSGVASVASSSGSTTLTVSDTFDQSAGNLNGKTPSPLTDGNWAESSAGSFTVDSTSHVAKRTGVSDGGSLFSGLSSSAKFAVASSSVTGSYVRADLTQSAFAAPAAAGVILRYVDASNWIAALQVSGSTPYGYLVKCVSGTETVIGICSTFVNIGNALTIYLSVQSNGRCDAQFMFGSTVYGTMSATDSALATGGALASGKTGIIDWQSSATANTRTFDNFQAGTIVSDAACYAGQSVQVRHDGVVRSSASGIWTRPSRFDGDYLLVPASGKEARPVEVTVRMSRTTLGSAGDDGVDDLSAKLYVQPRGLQLPS